VDPDPTNFELNVDQILPEFVRQEELEKTKSLISELEKQILHLDRELKQCQLDLIKSEKKLKESSEELTKSKQALSEVQEELSTTSEELRQTSSFLSPLPRSFFVVLFLLLFSLSFYERIWHIFLLSTNQCFLFIRNKIPIEKGGKNYPKVNLYFPFSSLSFPSLHLPTFDPPAQKLLIGTSSNPPRASRSAKKP